MALEAMKFRVREGPGFDPGLGTNVGGVFILVETHKVSPLKCAFKILNSSPDGRWGRQAALPIIDPVVKLNPIIIIIIIN